MSASGRPTARPSPRAPASRRAGPILLVLAAAAIAAGAVVHVPIETLAARGERLLTPGWHLRVPFAPVRRVPIEGALAPVDVDQVDATGSTWRVRLQGGYRLQPERIGGRADRLAAGGPEALARDLLDAALAALPPEEAATFRPRDGAPRELPAGLAGALLAALEAGGLVPVAPILTSGPAAAFPRDAGVASAGAGAASPAGAPPPSRDPTGLRLVLVGLDGADWDLVDPLVASGRLPRIARLLRDGARAPLRSYDPMISPLLWTTMATGVGPDRHGIADFQAVEAGTGRRMPITSRFRKAPALWEMLDAAGGTSAFVAWWASYPAEPTRGFQVSNLVAFETVRPRAAGAPRPAAITWPRDYLDTVAPLLRTAADLHYEEVRPILHIGRDEFEAARDEVLHPPAGGHEGGPKRAVQQPVALAISILTGTANYAALAANLAARRPDLTAVYFEGIDMMGHRFQHCLPPRTALCPAADFERYRDAVTAFYEYQDRRLGEVLDAAGDDATVLLVSDHGFRSGGLRPPGILPYTNEQPVEWHDPEGIFVLSGPGARRGARLAAGPTLFDIAPTLLYLLGLPADRSMPGRVLEAAIDPAFLAAHPRRRIDDWGPATAARRATLAQAESGTGGAAGSSEAEAELLASLRALGYIGGDEGGAAPPPGATGADPDPRGRAAEAGDTLVFYHRNLATYFMKRREYAQAIGQLRLADARQRLPKTSQMLSEALLALGRRDEAEAALVAALDELPQLDPEPVLWLVRLALDRPGGGREAAEAAARKYAARTASRPGLDDAIAGLLEEQAGRTEAARARFRASFAADPLRVIVAERLYALEPPEERTRRLLPALERAVARDPRLDECHNLIGLLRAESGRLPEAVEAFRRAVDLDPDNARFAANLGGALARRGDWPGAADAYARALEAAPAPATALKLGSALRRAGRRAEALEAFETARRLGEATGAAALGVATVQSEMGRVDEAIATAEAAIREHPEDASLKELLARLRRRGAALSSAPPPAGTADRPAPGRAP